MTFYQHYTHYTVSGLQAVQNSAARIVTHERLRDHASMSKESSKVSRMELANGSTRKPGKYGSRSFVRASANLWNTLRGERAAWLKNSPTVDSFKIHLQTYLFCERFLS